MRYIDKSTGRPVDLIPSNSEFLVLTREDDRETVNQALDTGIFAVRRSTNNDGVVLLNLRSDSEGQQKIAGAIEHLRAHPTVSSIVPAGIDAHGATRFFLPDRVVVQVRSQDTDQV